MTFQIRRERIETPMSGSIAAERMAIVRHAPMPLQALRRDPQALDAAEGHALGEAGVVAIEQRARIGMQGVDLDEFRRAHAALSSSFWRLYCLR